MKAMILWTGLILGAAPFSRAHENHEHPEHPMEKAAPTPQQKADIQKQYSDVVTAFIKQEERATGKGFVVRDEKTGKDRILKLEKIHKDKVVKLTDDLAFACSDFRQIAGGADTVDLDFYVSLMKDGSWKVSKVLIHKVNGAPRYNYNDKNEIVPLAGKKKKAAK